MASNKAFLLLALLVALVLVAATSTDLTPTSTVKENGKASDVGGVDDAKQVPGLNGQQTGRAHRMSCCYTPGGCTCINGWCSTCCYPWRAGVC